MLFCYYNELKYCFWDSKVNILIDNTIMLNCMIIPTVQKKQKLERKIRTAWSREGGVNKGGGETVGGKVRNKRRKRTREGVLAGVTVQHVRHLLLKQCRSLKCC